VYSLHECKINLHTCFRVDLKVVVTVAGDNGVNDPSKCSGIFISSVNGDDLRLRLRTVLDVLAVVAWIKYWRVVVDVLHRYLYIGCRCKVP